MNAWTDSRTSKVAQVKQYMSDTERMACMELDSHADTCCARLTFHLIEYMGKLCDVTPFLQEYEPMTNILIVKAATAYDDPQTGETYIWILTQALFLGDKLVHSLICLNQVSTHGVEVHDITIHLM